VLVVCGQRHHIWLEIVEITGHSHPFMARLDSSRPAPRPFHATSPLNKLPQGTKNLAAAAAELLDAACGAENETDLQAQEQLNAAFTARLRESWQPQRPATTDCGALTIVMGISYLLRQAAKIPGNVSPKAAALSLLLSCFVAATREKECSDAEKVTFLAVGDEAEPAEPGTPAPLQAEDPSTPTISHAAAAEEDKEGDNDSEEDKARQGAGVRKPPPG
jgi:hypothetical protein